MGTVHQFKKKPAPLKHKWWHWPWTYVVQKTRDGETVHFCEKCKNWRLCAKVKRTNLCIKGWVDYDTFVEIVYNGNKIEGGDMKPLSVWFLLEIERRLTRLRAWAARRVN